MKNSILYFWVVILLLTTACSDVNTPEAVLKISSNNVEVFLGMSVSVDIVSGNGNYEVNSSDDSIAKAVINGNVLNINGVGVGTTKIIIKDGSGATESIDVKVIDEVPSNYSFNWDKKTISFDEVGGYTISILTDGVALTDFLGGKQYFITWGGGYTPGNKENKRLIVVTPKDEEIIDLSVLTIMKMNNNDIFIMFNSENKKGNLYFKNEI